MAEQQSLSVAGLMADICRLGVVSGDVVMVHASLRAIGRVTGGADGVIDALLAAVGEDGTVMMNVGVRNDWAWVNDHPEAQRPILLQGTPVFDASSTPADPDNGVLAEVFLRRAEAITSDHPEGRFAAIGRAAPMLMQDVPWHDYYGIGSPLDRFTQLGGLVLRLGADIDTITLLHFAENLVELPWKRRVVRHRLVQGADEPVLCSVETIDDSDGIVEHPGDYFTDVTRAYFATGRPRTGRVGQADAELIEAADLIAFAVPWLHDNLLELSRAQQPSS